MLSDITNPFEDENYVNVSANIKKSFEGRKVGDSFGIEIPSGKTAKDIRATMYGIYSTKFRYTTIAKGNFVFVKIEEEY